MLYIVIVGLGLVGKELLQHINKIEGIKLVGVMNSTKLLFNSNGFFDTTDILAQLQNSSDAAELDLLTFKLLEELDLGPIGGKRVLIDCTASQDIADRYPDILDQGIDIVTANKKPFASSLDLFKRIEAAAQFSNVKCLHESSVGAGLPVINTLNSLVLTGDQVIKVEGVLSGTLSYLFNRFSKLQGEGEGKFSEIVKEAKQNGFTEPDPRDDLNGMDVARKVIILARLAGLDLQLEDLSVENIVPEPLQQIETADAFLEKLPEFDSHFEKLNEEAKAENKVLRYVGTVDVNEPKNSSVKLIKFDSSHPFAALKGSDNVVAFTTRRFPSPLVIQGAGAGAEVTVFGILSDLLKLKD